MNPELDDVPIPQEKKNYKKPILIALAVFLVIGSVSGYFYYDYSVKQAKIQAAQVAKAKKKAEAERKRREYEAKTIIPIEKAVRDDRKAISDEEAALVKRKNSLINGEVQTGKGLSQGNDNGI